MGVKRSSKARAADPFEESVAFFERHREEFLKDYAGKFIALIERQVVDTDSDWETLAVRVYARYGYREIFMPRVERIPTIVDIPTPFLR